MPSALPLKSQTIPTSILKPPAAGSAIGVTSNYVDLGSSQQQFAIVAIRAHPSNGSFVYVINAPGSADVTSFTNVLDVLTPGTQFNITTRPVNDILPAQYFIDVAKTGDFAIGMLTQI